MLFFFFYMDVLLLRAIITNSFLFFPYLWADLYFLAMQASIRTVPLKPMKLCWLNPVQNCAHRRYAKCPAVDSLLCTCLLRV